MSTPPVPQAPAPLPPSEGRGAAGSYTSPIPVRGTHLGHALVSEWTKIRSVRSTVWTLGVMFTLVVGIGLVVAAILGSSDTMDVPLLSGGLFGLVLGQICVVTLGVLVITSEYGTGMIRTTLTACPSRVRVVLAKALVFFTLSFTMTLIATTVAAVVFSSLLGDKPAGQYGDLSSDQVVNGVVRATGGEWLGATVGASLYVALLGLLALAVGTVLRHSAGAITTMLGLILLPLLLALFMQMDSLRELQKGLIKYSPLNGLASLYRLPFLGDEGNAGGWNLLWLLAAVTAVVLLGACALVDRRDV